MSASAGMRTRKNRTEKNNNDTFLNDISNSPLRRAAKAVQKVAIPTKRRKLAEDLTGSLPLNKTKRSPKNDVNHSSKRSETETKEKGLSNTNQKVASTNKNSKADKIVLSDKPKISTKNATSAEIHEDEPTLKRQTRRQKNLVVVQEAKGEAKHSNGTVSKVPSENRVALRRKRSPTKQVPTKVESAASVSKKSPIVSKEATSPNKRNQKESKDFSVETQFEFKGWGKKTATVTSKSPNTKIESNIVEEPDQKPIIQNSSRATKRSRKESKGIPVGTQFEVMEDAKTTAIAATSKSPKTKMKSKTVEEPDREPIIESSSRTTKRSRQKPKGFGTQLEVSEHVKATAIAATSKNPNKKIKCEIAEEADQKFSIDNSIGRNVIKREDADFIDCIEMALRKQYLKTSDRMKLNHRPKCLGDLLECSKHHRKDFEINCVDFKEENNLKTLLRTDKPIIFLRIISKMALRNVFPNKIILFMVLEHIMTINSPTDSSHDEYTTENFIEIAALAFTKIMENFPPCCSPTQMTWRTLILDPVGDTRLPKDIFNPKRGLFSNLLNVMEEIIQVGRINGKVNNSLNDSEMFQDFYEWESRHEQKYCFEKLSRNEKVERTFVVFNLLVQLMETDLCMWMLTHSPHPHRKMTKERKMPLIAHFLWGQEEPGQVNAVVKRILDLFVNYVSIRFSKDKVESLARLVNLIFHCINICERPENDETIVYPNIQQLSKLFGDALNKAIQSSQSYSIALYLKVLEYIQSPPLKLLISEKIVRKLNNTTSSMTPKYIYDQIISVDLLKMGDDEDSDISPSPSTLDCSQSSQNKYPCLLKVNKYATSAINARSYIQLLQTTFAAYVNTYHVKDIIIEFRARQESVHGADEVFKKQYLDELKKSEVMKSAINYATVESDFGKRNRSFEAEQNIYPNEIVNNHLLPAIEMPPEAYRIKQYREDIKYHDLIIETVSRAKNDFFSDWVEKNH